MARLESEQMSERIKSKFAQLAKSGGWKGGARPYGYDVEDGKLVVNKTEAKRIRSWARDVLAGRTVSSIVTELNDKGVPTARGGRWTGPTIEQILRSPRIIGMTSSGGAPVAAAHWKAIVDRATWEAVSGVLDTRKRGPSPKKALLSGLVFCSLCKGKMWRLARGPKRPPQYGCVKGRGGCRRLSVSADRLDEYVVGAVLARLAGKNLSLYRVERREADNDRLVREIAEDEAMLNQLMEDQTERRITRAEWITGRSRVEPRLQENRSALKALKAGDGLPAGLGELDEAAWDKLDPPGRDGARTLDERRNVLRLAIDRIVVHPIGNTAGKVFRPERVRISWKA